MGGSKSKAKIEIDNQYSQFASSKKISIRKNSLIQKEWSSRREMSSTSFKKTSLT